MTNLTRFKKERVIKILGGHAETAEYFGLSGQAISMWKNGEPIPHRHQLLLMLNKPGDFRPEYKK